MTKTQPLILVTNDDGITAPGIRNLVAIARKYGKVVVVAPDKPQSGQGHAITLNVPLRLKKIDLFDGIEAYECSGTPVDCVKLAKNVILKDQQIDLCVSGINHGSNAGINILYSGTMSAAMEASIEGIDSIGFSLLDFSWDADFSEAVVYVESIVRNVIQQGLKECKLLNVNIPAKSATPIRGIKVCAQAEATWEEDFEEKEDPYGRKYYWLTGHFVNNDSRSNIDVVHLKNNYISIVPSGHDLTIYEALKEQDYLEITSVEHGA
jgi:5'-nucleotidase